MKKITKNMCISAIIMTDFEQPYVVTICFVRYQLGWSKLVAQSSFSKLIKAAGVAKTINRKCRAKESRYHLT